MFHCALEVLLLLVLTGCTSIVFPPDHVARPATVYLLREAMHQGIVLPVPAAAPERFVEFGFGDFEWFARGRDQWYRVFPTMLWPTTGTLCRREHGIAPWPSQPGLALDPLVVDATAVDLLRQDLEQRFAAGTATLVEQPAWQMQFVVHDDDYWLLHTCADTAAEWLRRLGCTVTPAPIRIGLVTAHPVDPAHDG